MVGGNARADTSGSPRCNVGCGHRVLSDTPLDTTVLRQSRLTERHRVRGSRRQYSSRCLQSGVQPSSCLEESIDNPAATRNSRGRPRLRRWDPLSRDGDRIISELRGCSGAKSGMDRRRPLRDDLHAGPTCSRSRLRSPQLVEDPGKRQRNDRSGGPGRRNWNRLPHRFRSPSRAISSCGVTSGADPPGFARLRESISTAWRPPATARLTTTAATIRQLR